MKILPLEIKDKNGNTLAYIDFNGDYHCASKNKKQVVKILKAYGQAFKKVIEALPSEEKE